GRQTLRFDGGALHLLGEHGEKLRVGGPYRGSGGAALLHQRLDRSALVGAERVELQGRSEKVAALSVVALVAVGVAPAVGRIGSPCDGAWREGQCTDERRRQQGIADPSVHDFSLDLRPDRRARRPPESLGTGKEA